jgi:hypothetical protein
MAKNHTATVPWKVHVPQDLALRIESRFYDSEKRKPRYGQRNALIVALLQQWDLKTDLPDWYNKPAPALTPLILPNLEGTEA